MRGAEAALAGVETALNVAAIARPEANAHLLIEFSVHLQLTEKRKHNLPRCVDGADCLPVGGAVVVGAGPAH
jgi:hypothetical protein